MSRRSQDLGPLVKYPNLVDCRYYETNLCQNENVSIARTVIQKIHIPHKLIINLPGRVSITPWDTSQFPGLPHLDFVDTPGCSRSHPPHPPGFDGVRRQTGGVASQFGFGFRRKSILLHQVGEVFGRDKVSSAAGGCLQHASAAATGSAQRRRKGRHRSTGRQKDGNLHQPHSGRVGWWCS